MAQANPNRLNISLSGAGISAEAEELRTRFEIRLNRRLSMAQVMRLVISKALEQEKAPKS